MRPMPPKTVYLNDIPVGEASTWKEAFALLKTKGVRFIGMPGLAQHSHGLARGGTRVGDAATPLVRFR